MKRITKIGMWGITLMMLSACGNGTPDYDATGTFEATTGLNTKCGMNDV